MGILHEIGLKHKTDKATFHRYCDFYEENLPGRNFSGRILEIGVMHGASLRMWKEFYPKAEIIGIDIAPRIRNIEGITIRKIDSRDITTLKTLGNFDIIIDDGSHTMIDQQIAYWWLYHNQLNDGGYFIMEDCHTSFMKQYINAPKTTYDLFKNIDGAKEYNGNKGKSITFLLEKKQ